MAQHRISHRALTIVALKWGIGIGLLALALWSAWVAPDWTPFPENWRGVQVVFFAALVIHLLERELWDGLSARSRVPALLLRLLAALGLVALLAAILPRELIGSAFVAAVFGVFSAALIALALLLKDRRWSNLGNLGVSAVSLAVTLIVLEALIAPAAYRLLTASASRAARPETTPAPTQPAASTDNATPVPETTPAPTPLPVAQTEIVGQAGPGPTWGPLTGWGTNTNTTIRSWMDGVYDVRVEYNRLGFRGPEIPYEKPADVYRILLTGDSYIEAIQVTYEETVYAQLADMLKDARTPDGKRVEVFGVGATGWGTLQEYLYYHHEGYKFSPDLIIDFFVINDVADNNPAHFYDYRKIDFVIDGDTVQVIQTDQQGLAPEQSARQIDPGQRWLNALPQWMQNTAIAGLIRLLVDPPRLVVPIAGQLAQVHPQNYIYVSQPEIDGYPEGWLRTRRAYEIWAKEAQANGAQLMVVPVDISVEKITELSTYFADETQGWVWDADLPTKRLAAILEPLGVPLIPTRDAYERYGESIGQRPFDALFLPGDWHWNAAGHRVTAELLAQTLRQRGLIQQAG